MGVNALPSPLPELDPFDPRQYIESRRMRERAPDFYDQVNWSGMHDTPLDPDILYFVQYAANVESHTPVFSFFPTLNRRNIADPERSLRRASWEVDEAYHFFGLYAVLRAHNPDMPNPREWRAEQLAKYDRFAHIARPLMALGLNNLLPIHAASGGMSAIGSINEDVTGKLGYGVTGEMSGHQDYLELTSALSAQEAGHQAGYRADVREDLTDRPVDQKVARKLVIQFTRMVGSGFRPDEEVLRVVEIVSAYPGFDALLAQIDARAAKLPGMQGLEVVQTFTEKILTGK